MGWRTRGRGTDLPEESDLIQITLLFSFHVVTSLKQKSNVTFRFYVVYLYIYTQLSRETPTAETVLWWWI